VLAVSRTGRQLPHNIHQLNLLVGQS
jgi:hypothetical protein